uniref:Adenylate kinase active site lid domain-containing protein n=1 Tax=Chaetoceros debilis TaxID=122233 RepID=A0A7S3VGK1_9STRA
MRQQIASHLRLNQNRFFSNARLLNTKRKATNVCLIGKPGSGKGTYGKLLAETLQCPLIVIGDVLRNHVHLGTDIGKEVAEFQKEGRLADDNVVSKALLAHFEIECIGNRFPDSNFGFILDGFPRTLAQASISKSWPSNYQISFAVAIDIPDKICVDKMLGRRRCIKCNTSFNISDVNTTDGFIMPPQLPSPYPCTKCDIKEHWERRIDDTEEIMTKRLAEFYEKSDPVTNYFKKQDDLITFVPYKGIQDMDILEQKVRDKGQSVK